MKYLLILLSLLSMTASANRGITVDYKASEASDAAVAGSMQLYTNSYALVIGIDDYSNGWPRLSNAVSDANKIATALEAKGFDVTLKSNLDSRALEVTFEDFFIDKGADPESRLFVWYAGHGHTVDGEGYLIPADGVMERDASNFRRRSLSLRRFSDFIRLARSKHVYTVFDSCFAGTIFNVARSAPPPAITRVTSEPARQFLSSGDAGQTVSDDGTFANLFVEALNGERRADLNMDGYLTAEEMGSFLTTSISNYTQNKQVPRHGKLSDPKFDKGDFVFLGSIDNLTHLPPGQTTFSLTSLKQRSSDLNALQGAWNTRLADMVDAYSQVNEMHASQTDPAIKISAWELFQSSFDEDNPYSDEDQKMRSAANESLSELRSLPQAQKELALLAITKSPSNDTRNPVVLIETSLGSIQVQLETDKAPISVKNFLTYVNSGFYEGTLFHRVIEKFMIQAGGYSGGMTEKKGRGSIRNESANGLRNTRGSIAMARAFDPDSATSQFFINIVDSEYLNHKPSTPGYAVFGHVLSGMDVVDEISLQTTVNNTPVSEIYILKISVVQ